MPRLGFSYDLVGDGKSVVKAFFGRYYYNFADRMSNLNPGGTNRRDYQFLDPNAIESTTASPSWARWWRVPAAAAPRSTPTSRHRMPTNSASRSSGSSGASRRFAPAYVRKMARDDFATYNVLREGQFTVARQIPVVMRSFDGGIAGDPDLHAATTSRIPCGPGA